MAPGYYADGDGLYLQVTDAGAKSWIYRYMLAKRRREMGPCAQARGPAAISGGSGLHASPSAVGFVAVDDHAQPLVELEYRMIAEGMMWIGP